MPYWRLYYHVVWTTRDREPVIDEAIGRMVSRSIRGTIESFRAVPHAIGMMPDHVHVALSIPPSASVSDVVGRMKGASAHAVNDAAPSKKFQWQAEYGVLSFGEKALPDVVAYVSNQRQRHESGQLWAAAERATETTQTSSDGLSESARGLQPRAANDTAPNTDIHPQ